MPTIIFHQSFLFTN